MSKRLALAAAVILVLGLLFSPHKPSARQVNPRQLLADVLRGYQGDEKTKKLVLRNYTPLVEGEERMAGRDAWLLRLKPRVKHRPWRQVWIDKKLLSILAVRDWSHENRIRRLVKLDRAPAAYAGAVCQLPPSSDLRNAKLPGYIPSGFEVADVGAWSNAPSDKYVVYSDGLFNISLFYRFSSRQGREQEERLNVFDCGKALAVAVPLATGSVTVVADLPKEELLRIARSIR
jgi:hypothetical protein